MNTNLIALGPFVLADSHRGVVLLKDVKGYLRICSEKKENGMLQLSHEKIKHYKEDQRRSTRSQ